VKAEIDLSSLQTVDTSLFGKFSKDVYPGGTYGLRNNHNIEIGPDVSWQVTPAVSAHAFYTYQQIFYDQSSIYSSGTVTPTSTGYYVPWTAKTTDSVHTVGATVDWQAIKDVLKFTLDANYSYGDTAYALGDGGALFGGGIVSPVTGPSTNIQALPDINSTLGTISIRGEYTFRPNIKLLVAYAFERFNYKDAMYSSGNQLYGNALVPGTLVPNSSIQMVGARLRFTF